jgi:hypothetical protein
MNPAPAAERVRYLDGRSAPLRDGDTLEVTERPVLVEYAR